MIQFDDHIFQMGWFNHQPANILRWKRLNKNETHTGTHISSWTIGKDFWRKIMAHLKKVAISRGANFPKFLHISCVFLRINWVQFLKELPYFNGQIYCNDEK